MFFVTLIFFSFTQLDGQLVLFECAPFFVQVCLLLFFSSVHGALSVYNVRQIYICEIAVCIGVNSKCVCDGSSLPAVYRNEVHFDRLLDLNNKNHERILHLMPNEMKE